MSKELLERAREWLKHAHGEGECPFNVGTDKGDEVCLAALLADVQREVPITGETSDGYHTFNELYEHRHALFSVVCAAYAGWKSKLHSDGTMFDGWFIAGVKTPLGQATYHLPLSWWDRFRCDELPKAPEWDGHTAQQVPERICALDVQREAVPAPADERGFLIERKGLCLGFCGHHFAWVSFTNDQALRFARRSDAVRFVEVCNPDDLMPLLERTEVLITEHLWAAPENEEKP